MPTYVVTMRVQTDSETFSGGDCDTATPLAKRVRDELVSDLESCGASVETILVTEAAEA